MTKKTRALLEVKQISKVYGGDEVLKDVSFDVKSGEVLAIIGPNGSGKSTLIKIIAGIEQPTAGEVMFNFSSDGNLWNIGYVPQRFHVKPAVPLTVHEFLNLTACRVKSHKEKTGILEALKSVELPNVSKKQLSQLSGGQLQRVLIARALLHETELLLLDEPVAGIDVQGELAIYKLLKKIQKERGTTSIVVSHELDFVSQYATSVVCLNQRLICHTTPQAALADKSLKELYSPTSH